MKATELIEEFEQVKKDGARHTTYTGDYSVFIEYNTTYEYWTVAIVTTMHTIAVHFNSYRKMDGVDGVMLYWDGVSVGFL